MEMIEALCDLETPGATNHHHDQQHPQILDEEQQGLKKKPMRGTKRKRSNSEKDLGKLPKGVIHVRAKRGQATNSHSLAERARREKINERLKCLQTLVPGCYKTNAGMAGMLDVVINYLRSLENQIGFLSTKLSAANANYDLNSQDDYVDATQGTNAYEVQENTVRSEQGYVGELPFSQSTLLWP